MSLMDVVVGLADGLPSGLYNGSGIESYLHKVLSEPGRTDDFSDLDCELYLTATDLDTCERVVFGVKGVEGSEDVPISTAVRASGALPMVYAPVKVHDRDLIDGGIVSTTNLDLAIQAGAKLVVVINPIVPFVNDFTGRVRTLRGPRPRRISDMGFAQIGYQVFKLVAHQRLHELAKGWEERYPGVDIVLIEPEPDDELMFQTSMMSFTSRVEIARHGFESVTKQLAGEYDRYQAIAERHGFEISAKRVRQVVEHFDSEDEEVRAWRKILEGTTSALLRQAGSPAEPDPAPERRSGARARRGPRRPLGLLDRLPRARPPAARCAQHRQRDAHVVGLPRASPAATTIPLIPSRAASSAPPGRGGRPTRSWPGCRRPRSRGCAGRPISSTRRSADRAGAGLDQLGGAAHRLQGAGLGDLRDAEVGVELGQQLLGAGAPDRIADPQARQAPGLGEAAEHEQPGELLAAAPARSRSGWASAKSTSASSSSTPTPWGRPSSSRRSSAVASSSPVGSFGLASAITRTSPSWAAASSASTPPGTRSGRPWARRAISGIQGVGGPRRQQLLAGLDQRPGGRAQQLGGAVAEDQPVPRRPRGARPARCAAPCR